MGLFNKKGPSHAEKVNAAYRCFKPEMVDSIFPNGVKQVDLIIKSLAIIYGLNIDKCDSKTYYEILRTYSDIMIRKIVTGMEENNIMSSLQVNHPDLVKTKDMASKAVVYTLFNINNPEFVISDNEDISLLMMSNYFSEKTQSIKDNSTIEREHLNDPDYGLVAEKPIFTMGIKESEQYLNSLKTEQGELLTWNRLGSTSAKGISGSIDIYQTKLTSGKPYKTIYVSIYGSTNSKTIPQGFLGAHNSQKKAPDRSLAPSTQASAKPLSDTENSSQTKSVELPKDWWQMCRYTASLWHISSSSKPFKEYGIRGDASILKQGEWFSPVLKVDNYSGIVLPKFQVVFCIDGIEKGTWTIPELVDNKKGAYWNWLKRSQPSVSNNFGFHTITYSVLDNVVCTFNWQVTNPALDWILGLSYSAYLIKRQKNTNQQIVVGMLGRKSLLDQGEYYTPKLLITNISANSTPGFSIDYYVDDLTKKKTLSFDTIKPNNSSATILNEFDGTNFMEIGKHFIIYQISGVVVCKFEWEIKE